MSPPWSKLLDIDGLAESRADIEFTVELAELKQRTGVFPQLAGRVAGHVRFERMAGLPVANLTMRGAAQLICQRCLEPLTIPLELEARVGLVPTEAELDRVPEELEPVLAPEGRTSIGALVQEELLLALPIVPQHPQGEACVTAQATPDEVADTQKPFEGLSQLLGRK